MKHLSGLELCRAVREIRKQWNKKKMLHAVSEREAAEQLHANGPAPTRPALETVAGRRCEERR